MKKQFLSAALAALMIAGSAVGAGARAYEDVKEDNKASTAISMLSDIGVIKGTSETEFTPDENVSREQMAALLFRLMLGRDDAGRENTTRFTDLYEPYYNGAISWANASGYIRGTTGTTFNPKGGITKQDAMTMLVRVLGQETDSMNAGYPWSYINQAVRLGLDHGLEDVRYNETLSRAECAVILYNALTAEMLVTRTTAAGSAATVSTTVIEEVFGYDMTEAVLEATNRYSLNGSTVVKNGYVSLRTADGSLLTVNGAEGGIGDPDEHLGETYRLILKKDGGAEKILSAVPATVREKAGKVTVDGGKVKIGGDAYVLVDRYSEPFSTNDSELMVYAFGEDGLLSRITDAGDLESMLGFYRFELLKPAEGGMAKTALLTPLSFGQLKVDGEGKVNLAGNEKPDEIVNPEDAVSGDYVLYYWNKAAKQLKIEEVCSLASGTVNRLTSSSVRIGEETYALGNKTAGIDAGKLSAKLTPGRQASVVLCGGAVAEVIEGVPVSADSRYLTALTESFRVYEGGAFRYILTAFLDGREQNIIVRNADAEAGRVYRWLEDDGVYTLIPAEIENGVVASGRRAFVQKDGSLDEIAVLIGKASSSVIRQDGRNTFVLDAGGAQAVSSVPGAGAIRFIAEDDSVAAVCENGVWTEKRGAAIREILISDGASVTAVFDNEVGSVETLKYLSVSDGSFGSYDPDASAVRILAANGRVYEGGRTLSEYTVYDFASGKIGTVLSAESGLAIGEDYRMGGDGLATSVKASATAEGFVTGYTSGTVSVDGAAYAIGKDMRVIRINAKNEIEDVNLPDLYMKHAEFVAVNGEIRLLMENRDPAFTAEMTEEGIAVIPDFDLTDFADASIAVTALTSGDIRIAAENMTAKIDGDRILVTPAVELDPGDYTLTFTINSKNGRAEFTVEAKEEEPEQEPEENGESEQNGEQEGSEEQNG